jgi:hypothetical protein
LALAASAHLERLDRLLLQDNRYIRHRGQRALYRRFGKRFVT